MSSFDVSFNNLIFISVFFVLVLIDSGQTNPYRRPLDGATGPGCWSSKETCKMTQLHPLVANHIFLPFFAIENIKTCLII